MLLGGLALLGYCTFGGGGLRSVPPDSEFDEEDLSLGANVEMEHTRSWKTAKKIAKHHLLEDPEYYQKLATIHED